jgi:hypothetical protein
MWASNIPVVSDQKDRFLLFIVGILFSQGKCITPPVAR